MREVFIVAAKRTAVAPRRGALAKLQAHELAAPLIRDLLVSSGIDEADVGSVVMGNALYGGGNPARLAALLAGLPETVPALTIDTQCCSGLDAIGLGVQRIRSGTDRAVIAGGLESWSRSPRRFVREPDERGQTREYQRPPFSPWPERDPDLLESAAGLARSFAVERQSQERFAIESHHKALQARQQLTDEIVAIDGVGVDQFSRELSPALCRRLPLIAGDTEHGLTTATVAVEADAAAAVLLVGAEVLQALTLTRRPLRVIGVIAEGGDPGMPMLAPVRACKKLLTSAGLSVSDIALAEVMEAFAVQAMLTIERIGLDPAKTNIGGGGLARGHPVGASGAINVVRLWHGMQSLKAGKTGLATIAAAGGLGTGLLGEIV
ncbi:MAG: thiolase family protein [Gammaproteobacteria bacterium]|nr:thiolase family protein [Gammaproteobacteria bacterium]